jgi:hypothetical protein
MITLQEKEHLDFKLGISGTFWDRRPKFEILVNDEVFKSGEIAADSDVVEYHEFSAEVEHDHDHVVSVKFTNKTPDQTVKAPESTEENLVIAKDMLLNIVSLEINDVEIPIGADYGIDEKFGIYRVDVPVNYKGQENVTDIPGIKNLGWNGRYDVPFRAPFYIWLLENI